MENYKEDEAKDYWLIQFQRLLDSKPQVLIDEVSSRIHSANWRFPSFCFQSFLSHFFQIRFSSTSLLTIVRAGQIVLWRKNYKWVQECSTILLWTNVKFWLWIYFHPSHLYFNTLNVPYRKTNWMCMLLIFWLILVPMNICQCLHGRRLLEKKSEKSPIRSLRRWGQHSFLVA